MTFVHDYLLVMFFENAGMGITTFWKVGATTATRLAGGFPSNGGVGDSEEDEKEGSNESKTEKLHLLENSLYTLNQTSVTKFK